LLIAGGMGDAGLFARVAELLADDFTVITYDRRGNSRSPRPEGWASTDSSEQAADAAALLRTLEAAPAAVFGTSTGGDIALSLVLEHPAVVRGAIVHEPPIVGVLADPEPVQAQGRAVIEPAMESGGPRAAMEAFMRLLCGDAAIDAAPPELRERALGNGETFFSFEFGAIDAFVPDERALAALERPVTPAVSPGSPPFVHEATGWLAERLGVTPPEIPGHAAYLDRPDELATALRPLLREIAR
jgi:pimeloyl-ACP methyl ester carboxylesterase